jgi:hypothetical protein
VLLLHRHVNAFLTGDNAKVYTFIEGMQRGGKEGCRGSSFNDVFLFLDFSFFWKSSEKGLLFAFLFFVGKMGLLEGEHHTSRATARISDELDVPVSIRGEAAEKRNSSCRAVLRCH